ncbi:MAG TPA: excinuclease ABC subunit UvrC [Acidimicrobiales bacterium]|nr:excinuclease ABC subunit UvrC [Acidimicrobiales bacterium]
MLERPSAIPDAPGSYQFKDADGRVIYVGKARSLRSRLSSYFQDARHLHPRTAQMVATAASVEWIVVASDVEAIMLEFNLIKTHRPRFNVRLVDDKSYPYLAVTVGDEWPKAVVMRGARRKDTRYFGPYAHAYAIRETLDLLLRSFPIRTCSDAKMRRHELLGRPCLLFHIERCSGPCVGSVTPEEYGRLVSELMGFLEGDTKPIVNRLESEMRQAASDLEFERAARLRDRLTSVRLAVERQQMVTDTPEDLDAIAIAEDELVAAVQVLHVRRGRVVGRHGFVLEKVEPLTAAQLLSRVLEQHYGETPLGVPRELLVPEMPEDAETYSEWLAGLRGGKVHLRVPLRGRKRELLDTARQNAAEQLNRHRLRRSSDLTSRAVALEQLQAALGMTQAPLRIECYDMSHLQGTDYVGSMVVFEDGLPKRSDYRRFKVSAVQGNDDYGAMHEVLTRRLSYLLEPEAAHAGGGDATTAGDGVTDEITGASAGSPDAPDDVELESLGRRRRRASRFAYPPQLLLLDGGKGQLSVGVKVLEELGLTDKVAVASLAKQLEEVFVPGRAEPLTIPRDSEAIYLLQQARDEAHRFAVSFHRELRKRRMTKGALDGIPGLGPTRRKRLTDELGGVRAVQAATLEQLQALSWLPDPVAEAVYDHLHVRAASSRRGA